MDLRLLVFFVIEINEQHFPVDCINPYIQAKRKILILKM